MGFKGVQPQYVDDFCGRVPASVLARHYSDFSPEVLKEIYKFFKFFTRSDQPIELRNSFRFTVKNNHVN